MNSSPEELQRSLLSLHLTTVFSPTPPPRSHPRPARYTWSPVLAPNERQVVLCFVAPPWTILHSVLNTKLQPGSNRSISASLLNVESRKCLIWISCPVTFQAIIWPFHKWKAFLLLSWLWSCCLLHPSWLTPLKMMAFAPKSNFCLCYTKKAFGETKQNLLFLISLFSRYTSLKTISVWDFSFLIHFPSYSWKKLLCYK